MSAAAHHRHRWRRPLRYVLLVALVARSTPESVRDPSLFAFDGNPLADLPPEDPLELVRRIATARS